MLDDQRDKRSKLKNGFCQTYIDQCNVSVQTDKIDELKDLELFEVEDDQKEDHSTVQPESHRLYIYNVGEWKSIWFDDFC